MYRFPRFGCLFCDQHFHDLPSLNSHHDTYLSEFTTACRLPPETHSLSSHPDAIIRYIRSTAPRNPGHKNPAIVWNPITHRPIPGGDWNIVVPIPDHHQLVLFMSRRTYPAADWHRILGATPVPPPPPTGPMPIPIPAPVPPVEHPPETRNGNIYHLSVGDNGRNVYIHRGGDDAHTGGIHVQYGVQGWRPEKDDMADNAEEEVGSHPSVGVDGSRVAHRPQPGPRLLEAEETDNGNDDDLYRGPLEASSVVSISTSQSTPPPQTPPVRLVWGDFASPAPALFQFAIAIEPQHPPFVIDITRSSTLAGVLRGIEEALVGPVLGIQVEGQTEMVTEEGLEALKEGTERVWVVLVFEQ